MLYAAPLRAITKAARAASQENLNQRLALAGPTDELKELASLFHAAGELSSGRLI